MTRAAQPRLRRGAITLEFILAMPIIVIVTWGVFQFGVLFLMQNTVTHAVTVAAREGGKHEPVEELARVVDDIFENAHCIDFVDDQGVAVPDSGIRLILEYGDPLGGMPIVTEFGDSTQDCSVPASPSLLPDEVRVTICMDLTKRPICNYLFRFGIVGLTFEDKYFQISSLVKKE